jgi:hypothetical protein
MSSETEDEDPKGWNVGARRGQCDFNRGGRLNRSEEPGSRSRGNMYGNNRRMRMCGGYPVPTVIFFVATPVAGIIAGDLREADSGAQPGQHQEQANQHRRRTPHTSTVPLKALHRRDHRWRFPGAFARGQN